MNSNNTHWSQFSFWHYLHTKLLDKIIYYGIEGNELAIFKSFSRNRKEFSTLDTFKSWITYASYSVIQGLKHSSLIYKLYVNKVPFLQYIFNTQIYNQQTHYNIDLIKIDNVTMNYVDDSTSVISSGNLDSLKECSENYFKLLNIFTI